MAAGTLLEDFQAFISDKREELVKECEGNTDHQAFVDLVVGWLGQLVRDTSKRYVFALESLVPLFGYEGEKIHQRYSLKRLALANDVKLIEGCEASVDGLVFHEG